MGYRGKCPLCRGEDTATDILLNVQRHRDRVVFEQEVARQKGRCNFLEMC
jgi:hypothetical protein